MNTETGKFHNVDTLGKLLEDVPEAGLKIGDNVPTHWLPLGTMEIVTLTTASGQSAKFRVWEVRKGKVILKPMGAK